MQIYHVVLFVVKMNYNNIINHLCYRYMLYVIFYQYSMMVSYDCFSFILFIVLGLFGGRLSNGGRRCRFVGLGLGLGLGLFLGILVFGGRLLSGFMTKLLLRLFRKCLLHSDRHFSTN